MEGIKPKERSLNDIMETDSFKTRLHNVIQDYRNKCEQFRKLSVEPNHTKYRSLGLTMYEMGLLDDKIILEEFDKVVTKKSDYVKNIRDGIKAIVFKALVLTKNEDIIDNGNKGKGS